MEKWIYIINSTTENTLDAFLPSTDFADQALLITVPNDYEEPLSSQSSLSELSQNTTLFIEAKTSLQVSNPSPIDEMDFKKPLVVLFKL